MKGKKGFGFLDIIILVGFFVAVVGALCFVYGFIHANKPLIVVGVTSFLVGAVIIIITKKIK